MADGLEFRDNGALVYDGIVIGNTRGGGLELNLAWVQESGMPLRLTFINRADVRYNLLEVNQPEA